MQKDDTAMPLVFISYSRKHPVYADFLEMHLNERDYQTWMDRNAMLGTTDWQTQAFQGIDRSDAVILVVISDAVESEPIKEEIGYAQSKGKTVIPVIMQPLEGRIENTLQVWNLGHIPAIDFVADRPANALVKLLNTLKELTDTWEPLAKLITKLSHFNHKVRIEAAQKLSESNDPRVIDALLESIEVEQAEAIPAMLEGLQNFKDKRVMHFAIDILDEKRLRLSLRAKDEALLILRISWIDEPEAQSAIIRYCDRLYSETGAFHRDSMAISALYILLDGENDEAKKFAINRLLAIVHKNSQDISVVAAAVGALIRAGNKETLPLVQQLVVSQAGVSGVSWPSLLQQLKALPDRQ